jgi:hypothetical protein
MPYPITRIDEWEMRERFNTGRYWERALAGEFQIHIRRDTHPSRMEADEPFCTQTQEVSYLDANGNEIVRVHQYLRTNGDLGASGRPDPKRILENGTLYRLHRRQVV